jgi:hypothetical protein
MPGDDGFFGELRALAAVPERAPGYSAAQTSEENQADPVFRTADNGVSVGDGGRAPSVLRLGAPGPARRDEPNDYRWLLQHRLEIRGAVETCAVVTAANPVIVPIRPEIATRWVVVAQSTGVVVGLHPLESPVSENPADEGAPTRHRTTSLVITLVRGGGVEVSFSAPESSILWSQEMLGADWLPDGVDPTDLVSPYDEPKNPVIDRYVFDWTPGVGSGAGAWLGERIGRNYQPKVD